MSAALPPPCKVASPRRVATLYMPSRSWRSPNVHARRRGGKQHRRLLARCRVRRQEGRPAAEALRSSSRCGQLLRGHRCRIQRRRLEGLAFALRARQPGAGKHLTSAPSWRSPNYFGRQHKAAGCGAGLTRSASTPGTPPGFRAEGNHWAPRSRRALRRFMSGGTETSALDVEPTPWLRMLRRPGRLARRGRSRARPRHAEDQLQRLLMDRGRNSRRTNQPATSGAHLASRPSRIAPPGRRRISTADSPPCRLTNATRGRGQRRRGKQQLGDLPRQSGLDANRSQGGVAPG